MALSRQGNPFTAVERLLFQITSDGSLRGLNTPDHGEMFSVFDFITKVCRKTDGGSYARQQWLRMNKPKHEHYAEVKALLCRYFVVNGSSGRPTPCTDIRGLQSLLILLGGKVSDGYRKILNDLFLRYLAGDREMIKRMEANAASDAPPNVFARDALERAPVVEGPEAPAALGADDDETRTVSDDAPMGDYAQEDEPMGDDAQDEERMVVVRSIATELKEVRPILNGIVQQQAVALECAYKELAVVRAERDHERQMRHQADGRLGSETRVVTKEVRKRAMDAEARAVAADERAAQDRRDHLRSIQEITQQAAEDRRLAAEFAAEERRQAAQLAAEERRTAAASHQLLAETLAKLAQRIV